MDEPTFFQLVDQALSDAGRAALAAGSPERSVISVRSDDRVLQIVAGPGSGKTEMLIWRILYELLVNAVSSSRVMVTTFTRRAATELRLRLVERADAIAAIAIARGEPMLDPRVHDIRVDTVHALCDALLSEFDGQHMAEGTQVIDEVESHLRFAQVRNFAQFRAPIALIQGTPSLIALFRAPWMPAGSWPRTSYEWVGFLSAVIAQHVETWIPRNAGRPNGIEVVERLAGFTRALAELQARWEEQLDSASVLDFATIQKRFWERQEQVLPHIDHVFVDEFQDTNPIQFAIHSRWLERDTTRLTVVGDDDQSIYRFRGSDIQCFSGLEPYCASVPVAYRQERLEVNNRSTQAIVGFTEAFRLTSALARSPFGKNLRAAPAADGGDRVRLLRGDWRRIAEAVAAEVDGLGAGRMPDPGSVPPTVAVLLFSTSERSGASPATDIRLALEAHGLRVYNPTSKTATAPGSAVHDLLGLVSYLLDPVRIAPAGAGGRSIQVYASHRSPGPAAAAPTVPPPFRISTAHVRFQTRLLRSRGGTVAAPAASVREMTDYLDGVRDDLVAATAAEATGRPGPRLTLAGVVQRLITFPRFSDVGYTIDLFREAMFTNLLEAGTAPTRLRRQSLDAPLEPTRDGTGKVVWGEQYWSFLNSFAPLLEQAMDDPEVEAFADHAVALLTYHQTKGLEFDHVYVGLTGRDAQAATVLRTMLFNGEPVDYRMTPAGDIDTADMVVQDFAEADRDREVYVAITRPRKRLTILWSPEDDRPLTGLHPTLSQLFRRSVREPLPSDTSIEQMFYS